MAKIHYLKSAISAKNVIYWLSVVCILGVSIIWGTQLQYAARHDEDIHRRADLLEKLLDASNVALISTDVNGVIVAWNSGAEQLFGWTSRETLGCHMDFLLPTEELRQTHKRMFADPTALAYLLDGNVCSVDGWAYNKAGQLIEVRVRNTAFQNGFIRILAMIKSTSGSKHPNSAPKPKELLPPSSPSEYTATVDCADKSPTQ